MNFLDPGRWTPTSSSLRPNTDYRAPGTLGGRPFASTEHLSTEAVAAYVDGELGGTAVSRADAHLALCATCAAAIESQKAARAALRNSGSAITAPMNLLGQLSQIPTREFDVNQVADRVDEASRPRGFFRRGR
ncbi:zf-HC2 domain-containing protein [Gordonia sp. (in: high G+C Gram-positive bacteria)]|uniref:zf-HC2 domain-containing protein n=1 Tax=Gordonia sp. (in: high G+C Gram-positive bacteria) TaxID=84139 RepID=UPI0039E3A540